MKKLDILFIHSPKFKNWYKPLGDTLYVKSMPIGLLAMADHLVKHGYAAEVMHLGSEYILSGREDAYLYYIKETRPAVVGITLHWHYQSYDAIEVARKIRQNLPEIKIVMGGLTASYFAKEIMQDFDFIDGVIRGDGELPILRYMEESNKTQPDYATVPNMVWRNEGTIRENELSYIADQERLDALNYANYSLLKNKEVYVDIFGKSASNYMKNASKRLNCSRRANPSVVMPIVRGCPSNCKWCGGSSNAHRLSSGRKRYVFRSIDRVIDDIRQAMHYGFKTLHFAHYAHPKETEYYVALFRKIREEGIAVNAYFECSTLPTKEIVDAFASTFLLKNSFISISRMAPNDKVRKLNTSNYYTNDDLIAILDYINNKKISMEVTFTLAMPGENEDDVQKLKDFKKMILGKFKYIKSGAVFTSQIEPGSYWMLNPESFGIVSERKIFADFYNFHKMPNTSYFTHLGYSIPNYFKDDKKNTPERFQKELQVIRCKEFCTLSNKWYKPNWVGRLQCSLMNTYWIMKGGKYSQ